MAGEIHPDSDFADAEIIFVMGEYLDTSRPPAATFITRNKASQRRTDNIINIQAAPARAKARSVRVWPKIWA